MITANQQTAFARGESNHTELRGECPRTTVNVLDAVSIARDMTRTALVNEILGDWAKKKAHEAMMIHKLGGINPATADTAGALE